MKVKIIGIKGYNYTDKQGIAKSGMSVMAESTVMSDDDDGKGNFKRGYVVEEKFIPRSLMLTQADLEEHLGKVVDLIYTKELGDRYERLTAIVPVDE